MSAAARLVVRDAHETRCRRCPPPPASGPAGSSPRRSPRRRCSPAAPPPRHPPPPPPRPPPPGARAGSPWRTTRPGPPRTARPAPSSARTGSWRTPPPTPTPGSPCPGTYRCARRAARPPNPYWDEETGRITYCYGFVDDARRVFSRVDTDGTPAERAAAVDEDVVGLSNGVLFHELGHALVDLYDLPVTGREEDAVDQLAVLLLASGDERHADYAISAINAWGAMWEASEGGDPGVAGYSDVHSMDGQRFFNWACWLYGSDPARFADAVDDEGNPDGVLPRDRAALCPAEFRRVDSSWRTLLAPHLKQP
ncbi:DUF4344 domain-containing metallopeptidase [Streptomyces hydrogenans]|uniref:DUF4344 domain-containing metallopeptidase n=1 Tax=Streptomyces hydrogenans TaxID=1873719 RepID=UPI0035DC7C50